MCVCVHVDTEFLDCSSYNAVSLLDWRRHWNVFRLQIFHLSTFLANPVLHRHLMISRHVFFFAFYLLNFSWFLYSFCTCAKKTALDLCPSMTEALAKGTIRLNSIIDRIAPNVFSPDRWTVSGIGTKCMKAKKKHEDRQSIDLVTCIPFCF